MNLSKLDRAGLFTCCGSSHWVDLVMWDVPYDSVQSLVKNATAAWYNECGERDWLESFNHHPKIGDVKNLREKFAATANMAGDEQSGVAGAPGDVIEQFAMANEAYEKKFGFIFIVCATGKSAAEMLALLQARMENTFEEELNVAMGEQHKITMIRLKKILLDEDWQWVRASQLTTHVLDTSIGKPGKNINIRLQSMKGEKWLTIAQGLTNMDGRITDLLPPERILPFSNYKLVFDTAGYFEPQKLKTFYPLVEIQFSIVDEQHYHVPLLMNPFGYSTYRGS